LASHPAARLRRVHPPGQSEPLALRSVDTKPTRTTRFLSAQADESVTVLPDVTIEGKHVPTEESDTPERDPHRYACARHSAVHQCSAADGAQATRRDDACRRTAQRAGDQLRGNRGWHADEQLDRDGSTSRSARDGQVTSPAPCPPSLATSS